MEAKVYKTTEQFKYKWKYSYSFSSFMRKIPYPE